MYFLRELKRRNPVLFWYGTINMVAAIACIVLIQSTTLQVNGINAFIKPLKFYVSIIIFVWTMGWLMFHLNMPVKVRAYNWMTVIVMTYESYVISWQAANGRLSHFNITNSLYSSLFTAMGVAITILTLWTGYICYLFFKRKVWTISMSYVWGIRLGLLFFVIFALEGGIMAAVLKHTIGANDGGNGLMLLNWSRQHGDLRAPHFLGIHALQLFPLVGNYLTNSSRIMVVIAIIYLCVLLAILTQALLGLPLI